MAERSDRFTKLTRSLTPASLLEAKNFVEKIRSQKSQTEGWIDAIKGATSIGAKS